MPLYALTILGGAFLLFLVQPLVGKYILPWFGGSPGVWTTCLLFFQTLLLAGYAYVHLISTRLSPRAQARLHLVLLVGALAWLPIIPAESWKPVAGEAPVPRILLLLTACLGLPYLVLSATGPLLQHWCGLTHPGVPPYRLYALSNAGSLLALLGFPFVFEPLFSRSAQALGWSAGLVVFAVLCGACARRVHRLGAVPGPAAVAAEESAPEPAPLDRLLWLVLPAVASVLLLAVTNKLCLDVAVIPFLWVLPLGLYLLSFILCFDHPRWYSRRLFGAILAAGTGVTCHLHGAAATTPLAVQVTCYSGMLFAACMVCHGELHRLKPSPRHLTRFYLGIAAGGAAGSLLVAVLAPMLFNDYRELEIGLIGLAWLIGTISLHYRTRSLPVAVGTGMLAVPLLVSALLADADRGVATWFHSWGASLVLFHSAWWKEILAVLVLLVVCLHDGWRIGTGPWRRRMAFFPLAMSALLGLVFVIQTGRDAESVIGASRNFYGALKLYEYDPASPLAHYYLLAHGETTHGSQFAQAPSSGLVTSYYGETSGIGRALALLPAGPRRLGLVGLGTGTLAAYGRKGDTLRFYEINPAIVDLARNPFTYLSGTPAGVAVVLGDARLVLEDELRRGRAQRFDLLALDAFSSDAVPVHLLTREAFAGYLAHLRPGGIIAVHISNRHLDLRPVIEGLAREFRLHFATIEDDPPEEYWWLYATTWMLLTRDGEFLQHDSLLEAAQEPPDATAETILWTDDQASLLKVLK